MSILHAAADEFAAVETAAPVSPYRQGDRISLTSPEGIRFLARVEAVVPTGVDQFRVVAAVVEPRRFRSHVLSTVVDAA